jgi:hypothetical protein
LIDFLITKSGIKYAQKALRYKQSELAQTLAHHNLCIAYNTKGETELATKYYRLAQNIMISDAFLKELRRVSIRQPGSQVQSLA